VLLGTLQLLWLLTVIESSGKLDRNQWLKIGKTTFLAQFRASGGFTTIFPKISLSFPGTLSYRMYSLLFAIVLAEKPGFMGGGGDGGGASSEKKTAFDAFVDGQQAPNTRVMASIEDALPVILRVLRHRASEMMSLSEIIRPFALPPGSFFLLHLFGHSHV